MRPSHALLALLPAAGACSADDPLLHAVDAMAGAHDAGDGGEAPPAIRCAPGAEATAAAGAAAVYEVGAEGLDLEGLRLELPEGLPAVVGETVGATCAESIVPEDAVALGPAVRVDPAAARFDPEVRLRLPFLPGRLPAGTRPQHLRVYWQPVGSSRVHTPPFPDLHEDLDAGLVALRTPVLGTFQVGVRADDVARTSRRWTFRSLVGVSMGAGGAAMVGMRHPELFDSIVPLGGPFDWEYLLKYIHDHALGGFCTGERVGELCDPPPATEQLEHAQSYEHWVFSDSGGNFDRSEYLKIFQDLSLTLGNLGSYNPDSPFLPAGMPASELLRSPAERCSDDPGATFTIEQGYFDDEYNPDGSLPVIAFCDGETDRHRCTAHEECRSGVCLGAGGNGRCRGTGWFDGDKPHDRPTDVALAVDVNGNGRRDSGEPVVRGTYEPWRDVGADGVPSEEEPGWDPATLPDPADDDYDWFRNPFGTEGNWLWDEGEPFEDVGLDGVPGTADSPYDHGEGNGVFDDSPNRTRALSWSPRSGLASMDDVELTQLSTYVDAGIRDLFNLAPSANQIVGALAGRGANVRLYDGFDSLDGDPDTPYVPYDQDYTTLGEHVYLRYGRRDANALELEAGDGAHVGTITQVFLRFMTMLGFVTHRFPDGDKTRVEPEVRGGLFSFHSEALGGQYRYSIVLPPGYDAPENASARYPVVYLLHGYGMTPDDLQQTVEPFGNLMAEGFWPKVIIVYPDGYCGETRVTQCSDGVDNDGDGLVDHDSGDVEPCREDGTCRRVGYACREGLCCPAGAADCGLPDPDCGHRRDTREGEGPDLPICSDGVDNDEDGLSDHGEDRGCLSPEAGSEANCRKGTFFVDHAAWPDGSAPGPRYEGALLDLIRHVDETYRTRLPEVLPIP